MGVLKSHVPVMIVLENPIGTIKQITVAHAKLVGKTKSTAGAFPSRSTEFVRKAVESLKKSGMVKRCGTYELTDVGRQALDKWTTVHGEDMAKWPNNLTE